MANAGLCGRLEFRVLASMYMSLATPAFWLFLAVRAAVAPQGHAALGIGAVLIPHHKCETNFCPAPALRFVIGTNRSPTENGVLARVVAGIAVREESDT